MKVVFDIEANSLTKPTKIWVVVCKDIDTGKYYIFKNLTENINERNRFLQFSKKVDLWIGHHILGYDIPHLIRLINFDVADVGVNCIDTFIVSKLFDYSRAGHSIEAYGEEFGLPKGLKVDEDLVIPSGYFPPHFFSQYSQDLEDYCVRDVDIGLRVYLKYLHIINDPSWRDAIQLEHRFQMVVNSLHNNGFHFNAKRAQVLLDIVDKQLVILDKDILDAFPPKQIVVREFTPRETKFGTISKSSIPVSLRDRIHQYQVGKTYQQTKEEAFNPSSHKQIIAVLNEAKWKPVDKTATHIDKERELSRLNYSRDRGPEFDITRNKLIMDLERLKKVGWKVNENNLSTLPPDAPAPSRLLAKRILLESRRRTLTEWINLVQDDGRIHGKFMGIGAWTHRMAHQQPNTANIPNEFDIKKNKKLLGKEMRSLWCAPRNRLLVGVDAEGIQLRIFAHYIDDPEFTKALVEGRKDDKTDPHSFNQRVLGHHCKSRDAAKRFIFALLLGAGIGKLSEILGCSEGEAKEALSNILRRYTGFQKLKETIIPKDARRGFFIGLDGRQVRLPGDTEGSRKHLCMSGYLQNGEAIVMKKACLKWHDLLKQDKAILVNFVHDEWQTECPNNVDIALKIAKMQADSLREVGEELGLKCPLAGSYWNDDLKDYTIATNWASTH